MSLDKTFVLYAMEQEGDLNTRQGRINRAIKMLAANSNRNDSDVQDNIFETCGVDNFTQKELKYIHKEVAKRI